MPSTPTRQATSSVGIQVASSTSCIPRPLSKRTQVATSAIALTAVAPAATANGNPLARAGSSGASAAPSRGAAMAIVNQGMGSGQRRERDDEGDAGGAEDATLADLDPAGQREQRALHRPAKQVVRIELSARGRRDPSRP